MPEQKQFRALLAVQNGKALSALRGYLRERGDVVELSPGSDLGETIRTQKPTLIVLEIEAGNKLLASLRFEFCWIPIVAVALPFADLAFEAAKLGAVDLLTLPLDEQEIQARLSVVLRSLSTNRPRPVNLVEKARNTGLVLDDPAVAHGMPGLFNASPRMMEIRDTIEKVATTSATVLIRGESGVGKEIAARLIFALSKRSSKPFVKVNCAAIPNDLLESELFGYEAGAFTGAQRSKPGKFELADGGTLFLDEIGEMHPSLQAKLLHVLQDGEFARLGAKHDTGVDVRVLCATNKLLEQRVTEGLFREDLFYRINVVTVHIPPLRERRNEISAFIHHFIEKYSGVYERTVDPLDDEAMQALIHYPWPGNIRELENLCKRYVIVGDSTQIVRELMLHAVEYPVPAPEKERPAASPAGLPIEFPLSSEPSLLEIGRQAAWQAERQAIQEMLVETRWNRREAARRLRISYKALLNKIKVIEEEEPVQNKHQGSL
ncbi:MAG TPA: sigma-54 dependent transcriptional regulator [Silvibacterium sp.]|nr:sigma-54 dependent transcriptional regulator [Silvibacterium sp.]